MAFKPATERVGKRIKRIGSIKESAKGNLFLKIDEDCEIIVYVPESGEYFKALLIPATPSEDGNTKFTLEVNLDNPKHLELKAKDQD